MRIWRLTSERHASHAFDGEGARRYGGRFNHPGHGVVYCAATLSLAALELLVHLEPSQVPEDRVAIPATIPPEVPIRELTLDELPKDWRAYPAPEGLKDLGTAWIRSHESAVLSVPSAVIPVERNVLLHPDHPGMTEIEIGDPQTFAFDPRLWR